MTSPFDVFLAPDALHINRARIGHLATLGLDLCHKRVLEVGAGIGLHTAFFEERACDILSTDGNSANVAEMMRRHPHRRVGLLDLDCDPDLADLGSFDVVYCYGTLYHLRFPDRALARLAAACTGIILLETIVLPGNHPELQLAAEPPIANQALRGLGCRPTRPWVMATLRRHFGHAYTTLDQPDYPDFITDWSVVDHSGNLRAVFVGSKQALVVSSLTETLPVRHRNAPLRPRRRRYPHVWIEVGADQDEHGIAAAANDPTLQVHIFEPLPELHAKLMLAAPPNVTVHAMAVTDRDGFAAVWADRPCLANSLLRMDEVSRSDCNGRDLLSEKRAIVVPSVRLDTFMRGHGIATVDVLKIGAANDDSRVLWSLGDRLNDVWRIQFAPAAEPRQLDGGGADKAAIAAYLADHGFALEGMQDSSHVRKKGLIFANASAPPQAPTDAEYESEQITGVYDVANYAVVAGSVRPLDNALEIATPAAQWAHTAVIPVDRTRIPQDRIVRLALNLRVDRGALQVGVFNQAETDLIAAVTCEAGPARIMELAVYRPDRMGCLVVRNASAEGCSYGCFCLLGTTSESPEPLKPAGT